MRRDGEPTLLVQFNNHVATARHLAVARDVRWAGVDSDGVVDVLARGAYARVGLVGAVPWRSVARLQQRSPKTELVDATAQVRANRGVASDEELAFLREASRTTDLAMRAIERELRLGLRENELPGIVESAIAGARRAGHPLHGHDADARAGRRRSVPDPVVAPHRTRRRPHHRDQRAPLGLRRSDPPRSDRRGATDDYRRIHDAVVEAYERICATLRDGAIAADVPTPPRSCTGSCARNSAVLRSMR